MTERTPDKQLSADTINELLDALAHNPQGIPTDPEVFDAAFNFIETALTDDDLDDVAVVVDADGFIRPDTDSPFSIDE